MHFYNFIDNDGIECCVNLQHVQCVHKLNSKGIVIVVMNTEKVLNYKTEELRNAEYDKFCKYLKTLYNEFV